MNDWEKLWQRTQSGKVIQSGKILAQVGIHKTTEYHIYVHRNYNQPNEKMRVNFVKNETNGEEVDYIFSQNWADENGIDLTNITENDELLIKLNFEPE